MSVFHDSVVFKKSKCKPINHVTVSSPGAFASRKGDLSNVFKCEGVDMNTILDSRKNQNKRITIRTSEMATTPEQQSRIAARNELAIKKHNELHRKIRNPAKPPEDRLIKTSTSSRILSRGSRKEKKENELAAKLRLLQTLKNRDNELNEAATLASSLLQKQEKELVDCQQRGLALMSNVEAFLSPSPETKNGIDGTTNCLVPVLMKKKNELDKIRMMMKGTAAVDRPEQSVTRIVVTRKLNRRKSIQVEESVKQDNLRCDSQLSSVFLNCMYHVSDDECSSKDTDNCENMSESDDSHIISQGLPEEKDEVSGKRKEKENERSGSGTKLNDHSLSTTEIILRSTVPPWEAVKMSESGCDTLSKKERSWLHRNTQVTVGTKPFRSAMRLEDRIVLALDNAKRYNTNVKNNAVRTYFGSYNDSDEDEDMRPIFREEMFVANYYEPFGETFVSIARPPAPADDDEGADFYNEHISRGKSDDVEESICTDNLVSHVPSLSVSLGPPPSTPKKSSISALFASLDPIDDNSDE